MKFYLPPLRSYQIELVKDWRDEVVCVSSTQVGKTFAYACKLLGAMWQYRGNLSWWWCAPTYAQSRAAQREMYMIAQSAGIRTKGPEPPFEAKPPPSLVLINGSVCEYRTWDDPAHLMGDPIAGAVIDEGGQLTPTAHAAISTRRSATMGPLWWIGNPGIAAGPFRKVCAAAEVENRLHRWTWRTMYDELVKANPEHAEKYRLFIERESKSLPDYEFKRLYEAEWTLDEAAVFRSVGDAVTWGDSSTTPQDADSFVIGVDVAQSVDYLAAVSIGEKTRRLELRKRMRGVAYAQAAQELKQLSDEMKAPLVVEENGPGIALIQELQRLAVPMVPFVTTAQSKQEAVLGLAAEIAAGRVKIADHPPLPYEMSIFRYERSPSGLYRYGAPPGDHDDTVMAAVFARWGISRRVDISQYGWLS